MDGANRASQLDLIDDAYVAASKMAYNAFLFVDAASLRYTSKEWQQMLDEYCEIIQEPSEKITYFIQEKAMECYRELSQAYVGRDEWIDAHPIDVLATSLFQAGIREHKDGSRRMPSAHAFAVRITEEVLFQMRHLCQKILTDEILSDDACDTDLIFGDKQKINAVAFQRPEWKDFEPFDLEYLCGQLDLEHQLLKESQGAFPAITAEPKTKQLKAADRFEETGVFGLSVNRHPLNWSMLRPPFNLCKPVSLHGKPAKRKAIENLIRGRGRTSTIDVAQRTINSLNKEQLNLLSLIIRKGGSEHFFEDLNK